MSASADQGTEGPLAEFAALRQEIIQRQATQHNVLALQLTISGAVFSFALTGTSRSGFLLIIPVSTYMLCSRFVEDHVGIGQLGRYIGEHLGPRIPGGLGWESWIARNPVSFGIPWLSWIYAYFVTFPGVAVLALGASAPAAFTTDHGRRPLAVAVGLAVVWLLGLTVTALCCLLLWRTARSAREPGPSHRVLPPEPRREPLE
ncbi:hypothetical protein FB563_1852 [Streptomyces puniciscabiei]|uniref:Uncharacterized protein n=1 Tax=Streptomyces puniciscabiei TaxID=164348 RepID=A0A542UCU2_9ACTN|nr:hypothetical protein [Streptomyces puniciscabiei]TQK96899.1 hypothetical protein FB563_1852 [Streptomyces puniciscabiei]